MLSSLTTGILVATLLKQPSRQRADDEEGAPSTSSLIANLQPAAEGPLGTSIESRTAEGGILDATVRTAMAMFQASTHSSVGARLQAELQTR